MACCNFNSIYCMFKWTRVGWIKIESQESTCKGLWLWVSPKCLMNCSNELDFSNLNTWITKLKWSWSVWWIILMNLTLIIYLIKMWTSLFCIFSYHVFDILRLVMWIGNWYYFSSINFCLLSMKNNLG